MQRFSLKFLFLFSLIFTSCTVQRSHPQSSTYSQARKVTKPTVVIDPGHGNFDLGTHNSMCEEKELSLATAHYLKKELVNRGYRVIMTRTRDDYVPLKKRAEIANELKSQVMVSIHYNSAQNTKAHGIEIYYYPDKRPWRQKRSKLLAQTVLTKMLAETEAKSRGVKEGNFCVIRETNMPSILVEGGFITNHEECKKLVNPHYQQRLAKAIATGLDHYFSL